MRISDWRSAVCSSDLGAARPMTGLPTTNSPNWTSATAWTRKTHEESGKSHAPGAGDAGEDGPDAGAARGRRGHWLVRGGHGERGAERQGRAAAADERPGHRRCECGRGYGGSDNVGLHQTAVNGTDPREDERRVGTER